MARGEKEVRPADSIISRWQLEGGESPTDEKRGIWAVVIGGVILAILPGAVAGYLQGAGLDVGAGIILAFTGAFVGMVGGALLGFLVGLIGELIAGRLGLDRFLRTRTGGRLDNLRGRILYGGLLGVLGGPFINVPLRAFGLGPDMFVTAAVLGALLWMTCGVVGGVIDWFVHSLRRPSDTTNYRKAIPKVLLIIILLLLVGFLFLVVISCVMSMWAILHI